MKGWFVSIALACSLLVACQGDGGRALPIRTPQTSPLRTDTRVVGLVATLSGPQRWRGDDAFEGAHLAVHELNRRLPEGRPEYELVALDDRGDPQRATELIEQLAASERTVGIVYAGPVEGLPPAEPALTQAGIPAVLCYGDLYSARLLKPHVFQASPPFVWQARVIAAYLFRDRGYARVGILASDSLSGDTAVRSLKAAFEEADGRRPVAALYRGTDLRRAVGKLARRRVHALVVEGAPATFDAVVRVLRARRAGYAGSAAARRARPWRPQVIGFDLALSSLREEPLPSGTAATDTYARGAHYLPVPSFERFRASFTDWWGVQPHGWEVRAYDATRALGWAAARTEPGDDLARTLESLRGARFGGLNVTLGPDDHTFTEATTVGVWVVPRKGIPVPERTRLPDQLPWVPLARGFSIDGERTDVLPRDWAYLFRNPPPPDGPAPRIGKASFGVTTPRSDPVH